MRTAAGDDMHVVEIELYLRLELAIQLDNSMNIHDHFDYLFGTSG